MADFLSELSRQQVAVSRRIADALVRTLTTTPGIGADVIAMFAPEAGRAANTGPDPDAFVALLTSELGRATKLSVSGFTDLIAGLIVRSNSYTSRPFPVPSPVAIAMIAAKADVMPSVVFYAVAHMREMPSLPLLGRIENDRLIPDQFALDLWKAATN